MAIDCKTVKSLTRNTLSDSSLFNSPVPAMALLWNFHPYTRKVQSVGPHFQSPFASLNGFRYHDNWLRNLLCASSLNGRAFGKFL
jgi:hypothetical protein